MGWVFDILIVCLLVLAGSFGYRRGGLLIALEIASFLFATFIGFMLYGPLGHVLQSFGVPRAGANVSAFVALWVSAEILAAVVLRVTVLRRIGHAGGQPRPASRVAGIILNSTKYALGVILVCLIATAVPIPVTAQQILAKSMVNRQVLKVTQPLRQWFAGGLGRDAAQLLNLYTYTTETEATKTVKLTFTTTSGKVDPSNEAAMLVLINQERVSRGLSALTVNAVARLSARDYSKRVLSEGLFAHIDSSGHTPFDRLRAAGAEFGSAGENLALAPTLEAAHQGLMNSPAHRANILSKDFKRVGIGIIDAGQYGLMVTQEFTD